MCLAVYTLADGKVQRGVGFDQATDMADAALIGVCPRIEIERRILKQPESQGSGNVAVYAFHPRPRFFAVVDANTRTGS
jgi:hypothetical protein